MTPHQRIMDAARLRVGLHLTPTEVRFLADDSAISDAAARHDARCQDCGKTGCERAAKRRANLCCSCADERFGPVMNGRCGECAP